MTSQGACVNFSLLLAGSCGPGCWMASEEHALSAGERSRVPSASPRTCLESEHAFTQLKKVAHSLIPPNPPVQLKPCHGAGLKPSTFPKSVYKACAPERRKKNPSTSKLFMNVNNVLQPITARALWWHGINESIKARWDQLLTELMQCLEKQPSEKSSTDGEIRSSFSKHLKEHPIDFKLLCSKMNHNSLKMGR